MLFLHSAISYRCSIVTPVSLIRKAMSKDKAERASQFAMCKTRSKDKAEKASPEINDYVEEEEDRIEDVSSKVDEEKEVEKVDEEKAVEKADEKEEVEEGARDAAPVEEARDAAPAEEAQPEQQELEEKESEDEFNQIVDPEVEERVLVLTESVDDLRAEFLEFKRSSTIERERLEFEVRRAKAELQQFKVAPPADDNSIEVITYKESSKMGVLELLSDQFDDEGYMKCMLA